MIKVPVGSLLGAVDGFTVTLLVGELVSFPIGVPVGYAEPFLCTTLVGLCERDGATEGTIVGKTVVFELQILDISLLKCTRRLKQAG